MSTTRVILVRHGQSSYNARGIIQGRCDESVLTDRGREAARLVGDTLNGIDFDAIYTSPLQRAKQTAEIVRSSLSANAPTPQASEYLWEVDLPLWENKLKTEIAAQFPDDYRLWKQRPHEFKMVLSKNGQTVEHFPVLSLYEQAQEFWQYCLDRHQGKTVLVIAHNGINRCLLLSATGIKPSYYQAIQQSNCGISVLNFSGGWGDTVQLESMNLLSHLGQSFPKPRQPHNGPRLILVRHGETDWNRESRFQGQIDVPLNDNGREQARKAADLLASVEIDFALSSPMARPKETAEIILERHPNVNLELDVRFAEIGHGLWEGKLETEIRSEYSDLLDRWKTDPETVQMPEGENLQQVFDRVIPAWQDMVKTYSKGDRPLTGLVVGHDAVNKAILCHLCGLGPASFWTFKQGNGSATVIDYPNGIDGDPVLQAANITSHLASGVFDRTAAGAL